MLTLVIALVGIVLSLPLGILLALGRRSKLPIVHLLCVIFIEFVRGVPLITVIFMANIMLPLFLPPGMTMSNVLLRVLVGTTAFVSAYMAEVVRGGLQAIPKGQFEGAMALGLGYWQMMRLIVLPQALRVSIPSIVNTFIGFFKDTTLVSMVGLYDFLNMVKAGFKDANWVGCGTHRLRVLRGRLLDLLLLHVALQHVPGAQAAYRAQEAIGDREDGHATRNPSQAGSRHRRDARALRRQQMVRPVPRPQGHQPDGLSRRAHRGVRAIRIGQVDHDPLHQPPGRASARTGSLSKASN